MEDIISNLKIIEEDNTVPRNVRSKIKSAILALEEPNGKEPKVKIDKALQELDDLSDDPNLPSYTRTQIWNVVSTLESIA
ncbi:MAG: UPF0147 family protein [Candidatus Nanoarchaeia archaeon]|nr:UPF0147 family protein [Candidatus Nanoarchaeia archaeon]